MLHVFQYVLHSRQMAAAEKAVHYKELMRKLLRIIALPAIAKR